MSHTKSLKILDERNAYPEIQYERCCHATKPEKSQLLDEMIKVTGLNRTHLIELTQRRPQRKSRQRQRSDSYGGPTDAAPQLIWEAQNYIDAERLHPLQIQNVFLAAASSMTLARQRKHSLDLQL